MPEYVSEMGQNRNGNEYVFIIIQILNTADCCYNSFQFYMILHKSFQELRRQNIYQRLYLPEKQPIPHPNRGCLFVNILKKWLCNGTVLYVHLFFFSILGHWMYLGQVVVWKLWQQCVEFGWVWYFSVQFVQFVFNVFLNIVWQSYSLAPGSCRRNIKLVFFYWTFSNLNQR